MFRGSVHVTGLERFLRALEFLYGFGGDAKLAHRNGVTGVRGGGRCRFGIKAHARERIIQIEGSQAATAGGRRYNTAVSALSMKADGKNGKRKEGCDDPLLRESYVVHVDTLTVSEMAHRSVLEAKKLPSEDVCESFSLSASQGKTEKVARLFGRNRVIVYKLALRSAL